MIGRIVKLSNIAQLMDRAAGDIGWSVVTLAVIGSEQWEKTLTSDDCIITLNGLFVEIWAKNCIKNREINIAFFGKNIASLLKYGLWS